ncbi:DUF397 domain-containing protein [Embleya sp. AB8]|uniref:DUF397 domain-containing protein n=1 Tax=Embleya sp. AB8 TaxID=3156304 RepID=UPI003C71E58A
MNQQTPSAAWRKSSYSGGSQNTDCVEVAPLAVEATGVRDTKNRERGHIAIPGDSWVMFLGAIK